MASSVLGPTREIVRNPDIVRVELSYLLGIASQWTYLVSLLVVAYGAGGVLLTGVVSTARMLPAAVLAPLVGGLVDRMPQARLLRLVAVGRTVVVAGSAAVLAFDLPPAIIVAAAVAEGVLGTLVRPSTMSLMPALARSPEELVASNAVASTGEAVGTLVGPAVGGALVAIGGPNAGFIGAVVGFVLTVVVLTGVRTTPRYRAADVAESGAVRALGGGFVTLVRHRPAGVLVALFSAQTFVRGILMVLIVAASIELLGLGEAGVGYLSSAMGAGGLVGAVGAVALAGRRRLAVPVLVSLAAWSAPIAVIGLAPVAAVAFAALAIVGVANALLDVGGFTLLQRIVPNHLRGRVFGALEGSVSLTMGLGSLVAPVLHDWLGLQAALIAAGAVLPILAVLSVGLVRAADGAAVVPDEQLALLREIPMFRPLGMTAFEHLAGSMTRVTFPAGAPLMRQGDAGDAYYVLASGEAAVVQDGREVRRIEAGDGCGEIALLRDVPRTATVEARTPIEAYRLERDAFLEAVTGTPTSLAAADRLVDERLASSAG